ncbi:hypothetical protein HBI81_243660 [Parastagonospora nodorum]|nr:hypothetical protein HBI18_249890 [Parastagonospora nodorum]KAH6511553.1 hypothetical protein HBI81_243660 [Parastagonospora nodorum]
MVPAKQPPPSDSTYCQCCGRIIRIGQEHTCIIVEVFNMDSFNMKTFTKAIKHAIPGLVANVNLEELARVIAYENDYTEKDLPFGLQTDLEGYVLIEDGRIKHLLDTAVPVTPHDLFVSLHANSNSQSYPSTRNEDNAMNVTASDHVATSTPNATNMAKTKRGRGGKKRRRGRGGTEMMIANARGDTDHAAAHGIESAVTDIGNARGHATDVETMIEVTGAGIGRGVANTTDEMIVQSGRESDMQATCDRVHTRGTADQDGEAGRQMSRLRREGTEHGKELAKSKRESVADLIPKDWILPAALTSQYTETPTLNVLDVPRTCGLLTVQELHIAEDYDATALVQLMSTAKLKSINVVTAFCKRAAIAQQCVSCLTEIMFDEALTRARECDAYLAKEGKPIGPLHGLPISLKDSFNAKGKQATLGYVSFIARTPATSNSALMDILHKPEQSSKSKPIFPRL